MNLNSIDLFALNSVGLKNNVVVNMLTKLSLLFRHFAFMASSKITSKRYTMQFRFVLFGRFGINKVGYVLCHPFQSHKIGVHKINKRLPIKSTK